MKTHLRNGLSLGRVFGVEIVLQWGLLGLIALVAGGLALGLLPNWHPQWSGALRITVSVAAAVALLVSVLLHELVGILRLRDLQSVSRAHRSDVQVGMVMVPRSDIETASPSEAALDGLKKIAKTSDDNLVVVDDDDHVRGVLGQTDVIHYAALSAA